MTQSKPKPRIVELVESSVLPGHERYCTCCQKRLSGKMAWLELDQRTNTYHDFGGVPQDESQGWFQFGLTCARNELAKASQSRGVAA